MALDPLLVRLLRPAGGVAPHCPAHVVMLGAGSDSFIRDMAEAGARRFTLTQADPERAAALVTPADAHVTLHVRAVVPPGHPGDAILYRMSHRVLSGIARPTVLSEAFPGATGPWPLNVPAIDVTELVEDVTGSPERRLLWIDLPGQTHALVDALAEADLLHRFERIVFREGARPFYEGARPMRDVRTLLRRVGFDCDIPQTGDPELPYVAAGKSARAALMRRVQTGLRAGDDGTASRALLRELTEPLAGLDPFERALLMQTAETAPALVQNAATGTPLLTLVDCDATGNVGHFLGYASKLGHGARAAGVSFGFAGRRDLEPGLVPDIAGTASHHFTVHSWEICARGWQTALDDIMRFKGELGATLDDLDEAAPDGPILLFVYCGGIEIAEILERLLARRPRFRAVVSLFYNHTGALEDWAYRRRWQPLIDRLAPATGPVRLMAISAPSSRRIEAAFGVSLPVLPHPSTTFAEAEVAEMNRREPRRLAGSQPPRVLFPMLARADKGFLHSLDTARLLADRGDVVAEVRSLIGDRTPPPIREEMARRDTTGITLCEQEFDGAGFIDWLDRADVIVLPYLPSAFAERTSGLLVDACILGIPVVVVEGTWLAEEVSRHGHGVATPAEPAALAAGVRAVLDDYQSYADAARQAARTSQDALSWQNLAERVLTVGGFAAAAAAEGVTATGSRAKPVDAAPSVK